MLGLAEQYEAGFSRKREARFFLRQAVAVGHELIEVARNEPQWHNVAKHMLHAWDDGMASLRRLRKACNSKGSNRQSKPRDSPRRSLRNVRAK
ncbi:hypothetical protein PQR68_24115 [Paraburkholderia agricolaris]|uniref:hypothetical protein n=1 Tax=Paraburkholderia agricolaris TaxID=2152888 RepID=UPI0038B6E496